MERAIKAMLIDLDGVMYVEGTAVPGAQDALHSLEEQGYRFRFVSNTTRKSRATIARQLEGMGLVIPESHIFTPAFAAAAYLSAEQVHSAFFLTTEEVADEIIAISGIVPYAPNPEMVVVGDAGDRFSYDQMTTAFRYLLSGAELIALEKDRYWMGTDGMMLSAGPFVTALEYATGKTALVMGKPSSGFFGLALASMHAKPETTAMIGDDVITDIGGAVSCGLYGILVKTGKYREEALVQAAIRPNAILISIADLPGFIESWNQGGLP
jgi:HAD superfamily hydrolase (TIGR01458 family)